MLSIEKPLLLGNILSLGKVQSLGKFLSFGKILSLGKILSIWKILSLNNRIFPIDGMFPNERIVLFISFSERLKTQNLNNLIVYCLDPQ